MTFLRSYRRPCFLTRQITAAAVLGSVLCLSVAGTPVHAQSSGKPPIEILADQAIEWRRDERQYVAQGNAVAIQGTSRVYADTLTAFYREKTAKAAGVETSSDDTDIYRMEAVGNVRIVTPNQTITGSRAVREVDRGLTWIVGSPPRLTTPDNVVTAEERMEYWDAENLAIAKGNAIARDIETGRTIRADQLTADFSKDGTDRTQRGSSIRVITATGNVRVDTESEVITGDRGTYEPSTGIATLTGNVHLESADGRRLAGPRAEVNMKTGISRLLSDDGQTPSATFGESGRPRAIFNTGSPE